MASRKSWREKLDAEEGLPKIVPIPVTMQRAHGRGTMLIARPRDVDALVRTIRKGRLATVNQLRERLAAEHGADTTCPMTTGIFLRIVAEVAEEELAAGRRRVAPYWRVLRAGGALNPKFPGGIEAQARRLRAEGHTVRPGRGKAAPRVEDYERRLVRDG